jgi:neutral trehalase
MRRIRLDDGVFNKIVGTDREISTYDRFINVQKGIETDTKVSQALKLYKDLVNENSKTFEDLSHLEDLIILLRIRSNRDVQLYIQREYVYARQSCPRDTKNRDIRVCVGRVDTYPPSENLLDNKDLIEKADTIICDYLDQLIQEKEYIVKLTIPKYNEEERTITV